MSNRWAPWILRSRRRKRLTAFSPRLPQVLDCSTALMLRRSHIGSESSTGLRVQCYAWTSWTGWTGWTRYWNSSPRRHCGIFGHVCFVAWGEDEFMPYGQVRSLPFCQLRCAKNGQQPVGHKLGCEPGIASQRDSRSDVPTGQEVLAHLS